MPKRQSWYEMKVMGGGAAEILLYDEIGTYGISAKDFANDLADFGELRQINLRINSPGGSVFDGNAIFNQLKQHPARVVATIDGLAASMASVIAMAADHIVMPENALMMIHNPWMVSMGDAVELRKNADLLDTIKTTLLGAYGRSMMTDEEISQMMDTETWLTGADAVEFGFADELAGEMAMAACAKFDQLAQFSKTPEQIQPQSSAPAGKAEKKETTPSAVADKPQKHEEEITMPEAKKAADQPVDQKEIEARIASDYQAKQKARASDINAVFEGFEKHIELRNQCIGDVECGVEDARAKLLAELGKDQKPTGSVFVGDEGNQAKVNAMADVVAMRAGIKTQKEVGENAYRGKTLLGLAEACLDARGKSVAGMSKMDIVASAFTHSSGDFSKLLANTANKAMLMGAEEAEETFQQWTRSGQLGDFKVSSRVDLNAFPTLGKVQEGAEYKYATMGDRAESIQLATYGSLFSITRQAIINDDLDAFTRIPNRMGRAALRTVGDLVYAILTANPNMSDGTPLFDNAHNNLQSASGITTSSVDAMRVAMATQKDGNANLNIRMAHLLVPMALEGAANVVRESQFEVGATAKNNTVPNSVRNTFDVIADSRLDSVSPTEWFGAANGGIHDTIEVAYLDGNSMPVLEEQDGWKVDGVEFKVRMDAGVSALDFRTMAKNGA